jgi:UDP-N-acetylmuramate dehydrogenase
LLFGLMFEQCRVVTGNPLLTLRENVDLAPLTTMRIGGPARYFAAVTDVDELVEALKWGREQGLPIFLLGGGSNLLVSDRGFPGLVIHVQLKGIETHENGERTFVRAAAGEDWDPFVAFCVERNLAGIECLSGIPGSIGATPIQNVGAYGQDVSETIVSVETIDRSDLSRKTLTNLECEFGYRFSRFKNREPERYVVTAVTYSLLPDGAPAIRYPELASYLTGRGVSAPGLTDVREAVIAIRKRKGMVVDPADGDSLSAGSFFMNPILDSEEFERFKSDSEAMGCGVPPSFPAADGKLKTSAAWLIERSGFTKGYRLGRAGISTKHTLALVNTGGASAGEMVTLVEKIKSGVRERFGIELHPEPNFVGF